jgi:hypothetical protein
MWKECHLNEVKTRSLPMKLLIELLVAVMLAANLHENN